MFNCVIFYITLHCFLLYELGLVDVIPDSMLGLLVIVALPHHCLAFLHLGAVLNTLRLHPLGVALPEPAGLTPFPGVLVNAAVPSELAAVLKFLSNGPSEESLAALAGEHIVVPARGSVPTDNANLTTFHHLLLPLGELLGRSSWEGSGGVVVITVVEFGLRLRLRLEVDVGVVDAGVVDVVAGVRRVGVHLKVVDVFVFVVDKILLVVVRKVLGRNVRVSVSVIIDISGHVVVQV